VRIALEVSLIAAGILLIGFGAWMLAKSRVPSWAKGIWKWPLGDNLSPIVARLMGWSSVLVGVACLPATVMFAQWDRSPTTWLASLTTMFMAGAGLFPWIWSVTLSRSKPA
jgi:hypothetical protein